MKIPFFKITGIISLFGSILLLVFTNNLFLKFLSSIIILLILYPIIFYFITYFRNKKINLEILTFQTKNLYPFKSDKLEIDFNKNIFILPGFFSQLSFKLNEKDLFMKNYQSNLELIEKSKVLFELLFERHGEYLLTDFQLIFKDIMGLTHFKLNLNFKHFLTVLPYFEDPLNIPFSTDTGGEQVIQSMSKINSTDFFDNRKYYPGDDTRRINWKVFAHLDELHVREVEKIPPSVGEITIIFCPFSKNFYEYEYISSLFLSTAYFLLNNNFEIKIYFPGSENSLIVDSEKDLNKIINSSYKTINNLNFYQIKNPIVFSSFEEFGKLSDFGISDCFCAMSYLELIEDKKSLINTLFFIKNNDGLIRDIIEKINSIKRQNVKTALLKEYTDYSAINNVNLEICKVLYEKYNEK